MHKQKCVQILPKLKPLHQMNYPLTLFLDNHLLFHIGKKIDFDFCAGCIGRNRSQGHYDFDFVFYFKLCCQNSNYYYYKPENKYCLQSDSNKYTGSKQYIISKMSCEKLLKMLQLKVWHQPQMNITTICREFVNKENWNKILDMNSY